IYCASGTRSALAAHTLTELGYEDVRSMTGGITLWKDLGYKVDVPRKFTPEQRERYSRHFLLPEIGVGQIGIVDDDTVDLSNLQRQVIHTTGRVGVPKVDSAEISMKEINPDIDV